MFVLYKKTCFMNSTIEPLPKGKISDNDSRTNGEICLFKVKNIVEKGNNGVIQHLFTFDIMLLQGSIYTVFTPFPNKPWVLRVCSISLLKTLREKEKLLVTSNFSFCHSVFYLFGELSAIFIKYKIVVCKLFQFGRV